MDDSALYQETRRTQAVLNQDKILGNNHYTLKNKFWNDIKTSNKARICVVKARYYDQLIIFRSIQIDKNPWFKE